MPKRVSVLKENSSGLNVKFKDNFTGETMTRGQFANKIENGQYPNHHVAKIDGKRIPKTNSDSSIRNNLG